MLLFRSEEHVNRWYSSRGIPLGQSLSLATQWELAQKWYSDRLQPDWARRTPEEAEQVFASIGLEGDFWRLT